MNNEITIHFNVIPDQFDQLVLNLENVTQYYSTQLGKSVWSIVRSQGDDVGVEVTTVSIICNSDGKKSEENVEWRYDIRQLVDDFNGKKTVTVVGCYFGPATQWVNSNHIGNLQSPNTTVNAATNWKTVTDINDLYN